jgi:hypothetical protein
MRVLSANCTRKKGGGANERQGPVYIYYDHNWCDLWSDDLRRLFAMTVLFCTDGQVDSPQYAAMSLRDSYVHKVKQCARLTKEARDPQERHNFESERQLWRQLAERAALEEAASGVVRPVRSSFQ